MPKVRGVLYALACASALFLVAPADAQPAKEPAKEQSKHPGLAVLRDKCFQCHTDAMWRDARQDARWWEAALYRMVGRGGLWTTEEIKLMADYLGTDFGPNAKPPEPRKQ
jgi:mono/diheme cytochrome c family protein